MYLRSISLNYQLHLCECLLTLMWMPIDTKYLQNCMQATTLSTRCSSLRFLKLCSWLLEEKLQVVRDLQFGGLLNINCKKICHNICHWIIQHFNVGFRCIDISPDKIYDVTTADVGLVFGLLTTRRILHIASILSDHLFGTICTCKERLFTLPVGEEFRRCFIYYAYAIILAPTLRIDGCRNLWHTINEDGFKNDVN